MSIQKRQPKHVLVGESEIHGFGGFCGEPVEKNEFVSEYVGELISQDEAERRGASVYDLKNLSYVFHLNSESCVDAQACGNNAKFINHKKEANLGARYVIVNGSTRIGFYASAPIAEGEELSFDYNYTKEHEKSIGGGKDGGNKAKVTDRYVGSRSDSSQSRSSSSSSSSSTASKPSSAAKKKAAVTFTCSACEMTMAAKARTHHERTCTKIKLHGGLLRKRPHSEDTSGEGDGSDGAGASAASRPRLSSPAVVDTNSGAGETETDARVTASDFSEDCSRSDSAGRNTSDTVDDADADAGVGVDGVSARAATPSSRPPAPPPTSPSPSASPLSNASPKPKMPLMRCLVCKEQMLRSQLLSHICSLVED